LPQSESSWLTLFGGQKSSFGGQKSSTGQALLDFELLDRNAATAIICCEYAQADGDGQSARDVKSVKLAKRQTVVLQVTIGKAGRGTYRVRLSGAVANEN